MLYSISEMSLVSSCLGALSANLAISESRAAASTELAIENTVNTLHIKMQRLSLKNKRMQRKPSNQWPSQPRRRLMANSGANQNFETAKTKASVLKFAKKKGQLAVLGMKKAKGSRNTANEVVFT